MKRYEKICNTCEKGPKGRRNWQKDVTNRVYRRRSKAYT